MKRDESQDMGNFGAVERGELYAKRTWRDLSAPRQRRMPDESFDKTVRSIVAGWKANGGQGPYASRSIANAAQALQFPLRQIDRMMEDAIEADTPIERVELIGFELIERAREHHARKRKPAA